MEQIIRTKPALSSQLFSTCFWQSQTRYSAVRKAFPVIVRGHGRTCTRAFSKARCLRDETSTGKNERPVNPQMAVANELMSTLNASQQSKSSTLPTTRSSDSLFDSTAQSTSSPPATVTTRPKRLIDMGDEFWDLFSAPKGKQALAPPPIVPDKPLPIKLGPSAGRTVWIGPNGVKDLSMALNKLDQTCGRNKVKRDSFRQKFHERPGLKRKRLKSERWRVLFKEGFQAMVRKAVAMKKQGW